MKGGKPSSSASSSSPSSSSFYLLTCHVSCSDIDASIRNINERDNKAQNKLALIVAPLTKYWIGLRRRSASAAGAVQRLPFCSVVTRCSSRICRRTDPHPHLHRWPYSTNLNEVACVHTSTPMTGRYTGSAVLMTLRLWQIARARPVVSTWMKSNRLQLDSSKTEVLWCAAPKQ